MLKYLATLAHPQQWWGAAFSSSYQGSFGLLLVFWPFCYLGYKDSFCFQENLLLCSHWEILAWMKEAKGVWLNQKDVANQRFRPLPLNLEFLVMETSIVQGQWWHWKPRGPCSECPGGCISDSIPRRSGFSRALGCWAYFLILVICLPLIASECSIVFVCLSRPMPVSVCFKGTWGVF